MGLKYMPQNGRDIAQTIGSYKPMPPISLPMSVESDQSLPESDNIETLSRRLGEAIADLPEYEAFEEAKQAVEADNEAQKLIEEFEQKRQAFAIAKQTGKATEEDLETIKETQEALHSLPVMERFLSRQEALVDRLETINQTISEPLTIDFGGEAGGCCQD